MFKNNLVFRFATKAFDLAVIGGGPGGTIISIIQDMLPLSREVNWVLTLSVSKKEEPWEEHA